MSYLLHAAERQADQHSRADHIKDWSVGGLVVGADGPVTHCDSGSLGGCAANAGIPAQASNFRGATRSVDPARPPIHEGRIRATVWPRGAVDDDGTSSVRDRRHLISIEPDAIGRECLDSRQAVAEKPQRGVAVRAEKSSPSARDVIVIHGKSEDLPLPVGARLGHPTTDSTPSTLCLNDGRVIAGRQSSATHPRVLNRAFAAVVDVLWPQPASRTNAVSSVWPSDASALGHNHIVTNGSA